MKRIITTIAVCMITTVLNAQDLKSFRGDKDKWGFKDEAGKVVIPAKYQFARDFSEGLAHVEVKKGKFGFIDKTGNEIIPAKYDGASWAFSEGLAYVKLNGKYGFIDKTGNEVIPLKYDEAGSFAGGLAFVKLNNKYGYIDKSDKEVIPIKFDDAGSFEEGLASVSLNHKHGFIDKTGNIVIEMKYDYVWAFSEGLAKVKDGGSFSSKYGFIDKTGNEVIPIKFDKASSYFSKGSTEVELNGRKFYIDYWGNEVSIYYKADKIGYQPKADFTKIDKVFSPRDGMQLAMEKSTRLYGFLNEKDIVIIPFIYASASLFGSNRAPATLVNGRQIYIDKSGKEVINADKYLYTQTFGNGLAVVQDKQKKLYGFIDTTGKEVTDFIYSSADGFGSGLAAVCKDGKCGFLGLDLKPAIPLIYKKTDYFSQSGLAHVVTMQGKHGYINKKGEFVIPAIYDEGTSDWNLIDNNPRSGWPYHTYMVKLGGEKKFFDAAGKDVTPAKSAETIASEIKHEPTIEIKTKTHTLKIYKGWIGIFRKPEERDWLLHSDYGVRKPFEVFKEAPDGWLKNEPSLNMLLIKFQEVKSSTLENVKQSFIDLASRKSGLTKEKIKFLEEKITLPDGRKGAICFYVYFDSKGTVKGNYFDCALSVESDKNKNNILNYTVVIEGVPDLLQKDFAAWKDYFKKVLLTIKPN